MPSHQPIGPQIVHLIRQAVGEKALLVDRSKLEPYGKDATHLYRVPDLVVEAETVGQVQALLRLANEYHFPVIPRGSGTGLAGGAVPVSGGVVLSLAGMNRILDIDPQNLIAVVEPGVITLDLKNAASKKGLVYPPDPASLDTCSIGGNASTNAGGASCLKYGTTRDYVLGLEAVLPTGEAIEVGVQTRKGVVGYDLTRLLVGSEGTLGVITKLILKLIPRPPAVGTLVALFSQLPSAMRAVSSILASGPIPSAMEFMDANCLDLVRDLLPVEGLEDARVFLLIESDGTPMAVTQHIEQMGEICLQNGAGDAFLAPDSYKRNQMWDVRRQVSVRIENNSPLCIPEDVVVPLGCIADFVSDLPEMERQYGLKIYSFGHAGDGNIHLNITARSRDSLERVDKGIHHILRKVLSLGGTISGEHGIGFAKKRFLPMELAEVNIKLQKEIKRIFDPQMILNPGKIFDLI